MIGAARIRTRVTALAPTRSDTTRLPRMVHRLVSDADLPVDARIALRRGALAVCVACAAGAITFGPRGVPAAAAIAAGAALVWLRRRGKGRLDRIEGALPAAVATIADALRSGANIEQALALAAAEARPPLGAELAAIVRERALGIRFERSLNAFAGRCPVAGAHLLAVALSAATESGADLPPVLECIVSSARDRERLRRELRAATAQGRLTAIVVGSLPAAFLLVLGTGAREELRLLFGEPIGWALLAAGGGLEAAGFAWINRMVKP